MRVGALVIAMATVLAVPEPASAVIGGREGGPAAGSTLMVLNARGGVCSGIVLSARAILTAAHCVAGSSEIRIHWKEGGAEPVLIPPASVTLHPGYDGDAIAARRRSIDMALLRMAAPLPRRFAPATLHEGELPRAGSAVTLAGYGVSREGEAQTTGTYRSVALAAVEPYGPGRLLIWAQDPKAAGKSGAGACQGDSGGPIISPEGSIVAVSSWSTGPAGRRCGLLSQGALVAPQRSWIDRTLSSWGESAAWSGPR